MSAGFVDAPVAVSSRSWARDATLPALLVLLALVVRLVFFIGYQGRDDRNYIAYAQFVNAGQPVSALDVSTQWVGRVGFWLPLAASMKAFGNSSFGYTAFPLICSLIGVVLTLRLGAITVGRRAAILAAVLLALMPLDVLYATRAYPDVPVGLFMVMALWLALESRASGSVVQAIVGGLALGAAYLNKETAIFAVVPIAFALRAWTPRYWRQLLLIGAAFAVVVVAEFSFWSIAKGDPLYRFHTADAALGRVLDRQSDAGSAGFNLIPGPRPDEIYRSSNSLLDAALMLTTNEEFALFYWVAIPVLALLWWKADAPTRDLRMWSVFLLLMFLFFPVHWPSYTLPRDPRYFTCLTIPVLLVLAAFMERLKPVTRSMGVTLLAATSLAAVFVGQQVSGMQPQEVLTERYLASGETFWTTPQLASDVLILEGARDTARLRIHLLEQGRTAAGYQTARLIDPAIRVADTPKDIHGGVLVLRERNSDRLPEGWTISEHITEQPTAPIALAQSALRAAGLGSVARKLAPAGGESINLYRCQALACAS